MSVNLSAIRRDIVRVLKDAPTGGTERERQAYRNGVRELAQVLGEHLANDPEYFEPEASGPHRPLYEDGGRQAGIDYMNESVKCEHCDTTMSRREMFIHIQHPCPGLLASQQNGERLIEAINRQTERDPEPF
jgi:hypothetical protein